MNIVDVNDVVPSFQDPGYTGTVREEQAIGEEVIVVRKRL